VWLESECIVKVKVICITTDSQSASLSWYQALGTRYQIFPSFFCIDSCEFLDVGHPLWRQYGSVIYCTIASGPCQSCHSWIEVPKNSYHILLSHLRLPQPAGPGPRIYPPPQGTGWPSYTPGHWVPFCRILRLTGLRWRYSNPPPHGEEWDLSTISYIGTEVVVDDIQKHNITNIWCTTFISRTCYNWHW
jgi:hypothetical protein